MYGTLGTVGALRFSTKVQSGAVAECSTVEVMAAVDHSFLDALDGYELAGLIAAAQALQHHRALSRGDLDALIAEGFDIGFDAKGVAREPYLRGDVLVCPGSVVEKSNFSHDCVFVHIGDDWVWGSQSLLLDEVRKVPVKARSHQRSVSLVAATEGLEFDWVCSAMRNSVHAMKRAHKYSITNAELVLVSGRSAVARAVSH